MQPRSLVDSGLRMIAVDDDSAWLDQLRRMFAAPDLRLIGTALSGQEGRQRAGHLAPDIVLIDQSLPDMSGLDLARHLADECPGAVLYLMTDAPSAELWQAAAARGIREVFKKPFTRADVDALLREGVQDARQRAQHATERWSLREQGPRQPPRPEVFRRQVVALHSPKGGVGKTTLAVNLAMAIQTNRVMRLRVCLVDLDLTFGSIAAMLGLGLPARSVADWAYVQPSGSETPEMVDNMLVRHPTGLLVLPAPPTPSQAMEVTPAVVERVLTVLHRHCDLVIADTSPSLDDATVVALHLADRVFEVATLDVQDLERLVKLYRDVELRFSSPDLHIDLSKFNLVLNRVTQPPALPLREVARSVPFPLVGEIPHDPLVLTAVNAGEQLVLTQPDGPFARAVLGVANQFAGVFPATGRRPARWWQRLARRSQPGRP